MKLSPAVENRNMPNNLLATVDIGSHSCILLIAAFEKAPSTSSWSAATGSMDSPHSGTMRTKVTSNQVLSALPSVENDGVEGSKN